MADAMESLWEYVDEEAANELVDTSVIVL